MKKFYFILILTLLPGINLLSQTIEVELGASIDNTIFKGLVLSNGLGEYFFAGTTKDNVTKRALVMFDLIESVPEGVTVDSAILVLHPTKVKPGSTSINVHMLTTEWGEGTSKAEDGDGKGAIATANDATWEFAKFNTHPWIKTGGDYALDESATSTVSTGNDAEFSSILITANVNFWLANPSNNYGWILIGDELSTSTSAKFGSRDNIDPLLWPILKLYYQGSTSINQLAHSNSDLTVYQGANMDEIIVSNNGDPVSSFMEVYSVTGTKVYSSQFQISQGENTVNVGIQEAGIYIYQIMTNGIPTSGKLMITR
jgi:hypothetical protein